MKQNAGLIAALTVFVAFFGFSNLPKNAPGSSATASAKAKTKTPTKPNQGDQLAQYVACREITDRLQPFVNLTPLERVDLPETCYLPHKTHEPLMPMSVPAGVRFAITTVPNPISTHLPLMFDRMVEVIQQAAQDDNYSYDSSWFPWNEVSKEYSSLDDQHTAELAQDIQEAQPGVIVFRGSVEDADDLPYQNGLMVFVVAEQPTGGINQEEFDNALAWIGKLGALTVERKLKILGPSFSGSLPSLAKALSSKRLAAFAGTLSIDVSSGSVSSEPSINWFKKQIEHTHIGTFRTAVEVDSVMLERFLLYLGNQKYPLCRVAVISEDETAFGVSPKNRNTNKKDNEGKSDCKPREEDYPISLFYPRDIATLRSAYEQQSIFNTGKQQSSNSTASTTLRGDLSEPENSNHDTVRSYGGQLTPLAQESVLQGITSVLKEKRIQFVILRSTNPLDEIFLSQYFRRSYPEARIVMNGADLLFERGAEGSSLRGVMTLSSYPLLTVQQDWTFPLLYPKNGSYRIFGDDVAEGLYIAARDMFRNHDSTRDPHIPINNYVAPAWALSPNGDRPEERPATWISVIGHHQFWPVAVLNPDTLPDTSTSDLLPTASMRKDEPVFLDDADKHPLRLTTELVVLLMVCSVWSLLHFIWCWRGSLTRFPSLFRLAYFAPVFLKQHSLLIAFGSLLPAMVAIVTAATSGLFTWSLDWRSGTTLAIWALLILLTSFVACWKNFTLPSVSGKPSGKWQLWVGGGAVVFFVSFVLVHVFLVNLLTPANRIPGYWRSAHMLSGVSALLPQLLLLVGLYSWFWFALRGLALFGGDRPLLPSASSLPLGKNGKEMMPMFSREEAAAPVEAEAIPMGRYYPWTLLGTIFATCGVFALILEGHTLRTLSEREFGIMMFYWISLCIALILADMVQLWMTWKELRSLLVYLDRLPLRRTLASLKGLSWGSIWAMSGNTLEERYRLISRQFESLRHLGNLLNAWAPHTKEEAEVVEQIGRCLSKGTCFVYWYVKPEEAVTTIGPLRRFQKELATTAGMVVTKLLLPQWQLETVSLIFDRTRAGGKSDAKDEDNGSGGGTVIADDVPAYVLAGEEFFVLPYLGFIQNILGRIRTIILGSLFLFVATTFAVSSYPFDPLPVLGGIFLAVFAITGGTVVIVYAEMHRDATLSHITNTSPGELGGQFWMHVFTFGIGPLLGLMTTLFPSITEFVSSWLQPSVQALK